MTHVTGPKIWWQDPAAPAVKREAGEERGRWGIPGAGSDHQLLACVK